MTALFSVKKILLYCVILSAFLGIIIYKKIISAQTNGIPHIIHYVWFGEEEPPQNVKNAIKSWQKAMPDWKIKRWNEKNCDINDNKFVKTNFDKKRYDFASDYCRIYALEKEGGVYFDTDSILYASIDPLLKEQLVLTKESQNMLSASFIAGSKNHFYFKRLLQKYRNDDAFHYWHSPHMFTSIFQEVFSSDLTEKREEGLYIIYDSNILMLNFQGPENIAEHLYAQGTGSTNKCGHYCTVFKEKFLNSNAYRLLDRNNQWLMPLENNQCYIVQEKNGEFISTTPKKSFPCQINNSAFLSFQNEAGQEVTYHCLKNTACALSKDFSNKNYYHATHPYWQGFLLILNDRVQHLETDEWGDITEKTDSMLCIKWDLYPKECFIWDEEKKTYVFQ